MFEIRVKVLESQQKLLWLQSECLKHTKRDNFEKNSYKYRLQIEKLSLIFRSFNNRLVVNGIFIKRYCSR